MNIFHFGQYYPECVTFFVYYTYFSFIVLFLSFLAFFPVSLYGVVVLRGIGVYRHVIQPMWSRVFSSLLSSSLSLSLLACRFFLGVLYLQLIINVDTFHFYYFYQLSRPGFSLCNRFETYSRAAFNKAHTLHSIAAITANRFHQIFRMIWLRYCYVVCWTFGSRCSFPRFDRSLTFGCFNV